MISTSNVTLRVGKKALFEDVSIKFTEGNCYGLIGANGAGKSTFLKILSGQLEPTNGEVIITPGERLSFLQQDHFKYDEYMVLDTVIMGNARLYEIMKEKEVLYAKKILLMKMDPCQRTGRRVCNHERMGSRVRCRYTSEWTWNWYRTPLHHDEGSSWPG